MPYVSAFRQCRRVQLGAGMCIKADRPRPLDPWACALASTARATFAHHLPGENISFWI
jgi:hypothetical protein